jgi:hypothetical protein
MRAARHSVGQRDATRFSLSDDGVFRFSLRVGANLLEILLLGELDLPWRGEERRSGIFPRVARPGPGAPRPGGAPLALGR